MRNRWLVPVGAVAAVLVVAACGSSSSGSGGGSPAASAPAASSGNTLGTMKIGSATVLTNSKGHTLYWFALDTPTASKCDATCVHFWPPVTGAVTAGSGVSGQLGTITRSTGAKQATWNGHPLYTYIGDTAAGTDKGNGINLNGGIWHAIVLTGTVAPASSPSAASGGGGYGY